MQHLLCALYCERNGIARQGAKDDYRRIITEELGVKAVIDQKMLLPLMVPSLVAASSADCSCSADMPISF